MKTATVCLLTLLLAVSASAQPDPPRALGVMPPDLPQPLWNGEVTVTWLPPAIEGDLYRNDFDDGNLDGWWFNNIPEVWSADQGRLELDVDSTFATSDYPAYYSGDTFGEFVYDIDLGFSNTGDSDSDSYLYALLQVNPYDYDEYKQLCLYLSDDTSSYAPRVRLLRRDNNHWYQIIDQPVDVPTGSDVPHHLTVTTFNSTTAVYLDGQIVAISENSQSGLIGLGATWDTDNENLIWFDNLNLSSVNPNGDILEYRLYEDGELAGVLSQWDLVHNMVLEGYGWHSFTMTAVTAQGESEPCEPFEIYYPDPYQDVLAFEDFDNGLPPSWSVESHPVSSSTWQVSNSDWMLPRPPYMLIATYGEGDHTPWTSLISPVFSLNDPQQTGSDPALIFTNADGYQCNPSVDITTDGGTTWDFLGEPGYSWHAHYDTLSLDRYDGQDSLQIRFHVEYPYNGCQWAVDEILVKYLEVASDVEQPEASTLPGRFELKPVYPNPFNASASVTVTLPSPGDLRLNVYNVMGQQVATFATGMASAGTHTYSLNASTMASGIYFVRAEMNGQARTQKIVVMK